MRNFLLYSLIIAMFSLTTITVFGASPGDGDETTETIDSLDRHNTSFNLTVGATPVEPEPESSRPPSVSPEPTPPSSSSGTTTGGQAWPYDENTNWYNNSSNTSSEYPDYNVNTNLDTTTSPNDGEENNPQTGDSSRILVQGLAIVIMAVSGSLLIYELFFNKKDKNKETEE